MLPLAPASGKITKGWASRRKLREQVKQVKQRLHSLPVSEAVMRQSLDDDRKRLSSLVDTITLRTGRGKLTSGEMLRTPVIGRSYRIALQASNNDTPTHLRSRNACVECQWKDTLAVCINCSASICMWHRDLVQRTGKRQKQNLGSSTCVCSNATACGTRTQTMQTALKDIRGAD
jgi:hypothetical protein